MRRKKKRLYQLPLNAAKELKVETIAPTTIWPCRLTKMLGVGLNNVENLKKNDMTSEVVVQERNKTMEIFFNIGWLI